MATKSGTRPRPRRQLPWRRILRAVLATTLFAGIALAVSLAAINTWPELFFRVTELLPRNDQKFADDASGDEEFFKYGSLGNEARDGIPFKVWKVLPKVCPRLISRDGYADFGFVFEAGKQTPIGFSRVGLGGIEQMAINCSICHVERFRVDGDTAPRVFVGGASNTLDAQRYLRFLAGCAATAGFDTDRMLAAMREEFPDMGWLERQMFRVLLPIVKRAILDEARSYSWTWSRPMWGPGRVDPFNPVKFSYLEQPIDNTVGNSDMMPVWNAEMKEEIVRKRDPNEPIYWHWDGLSSDLKEVIVNSALGDGMTRAGYKPEIIDRLYRYLKGLHSPKAPLTVDPALKAQGETVFATHCASCHAPDGPQVLKLVPIAEIGTDNNRLLMWTQAANDAYNLYDKDHKPDRFDWTLDKFSKNEAYLSQPLNGIWLTGPYLHNGSVPSLDDLLKPASERPKAYLRGSETLDLVKGGFVTTPCEPASHSGPGFCYDTALKGNGNGGHEYGTGLTEPERRALVHYLLTL